MNKIILFGLLTAVLFAGCTLGPDFQKPQPKTPKQYKYETANPDSLTNIQWWTLFNDPALDTLVKQALVNNKDLQVAAWRIEEYRASLGFTRADQYPSLDYQGGVSRGNFTGTSIMDADATNMYLAPVLSWELDFWGKYARYTEAARADLLASEYSLRTIQISLISEVIATYFQLLDYRERLNISKSTLESRENSLKIIQQKFDGGIIPEIDLNQAQIQRESAAASVPYYDRFVRKTENALSILIGRLPNSVAVGIGIHEEVAPPKIPTGLPSQLLARRPDIMDAEYQLRSANANIGVAEAMRLPSFNLTAMFGAASPELSDFTSSTGWSLAGTFTGPIFNFGKNLDRVRVEEARTKQAYYNYESTVLGAFRDVEDALIEIETYDLQLIAQEKQYKAAQNALILSRSRYNKGVSSYLEVLEQERTLFQVELDFSQMKQNYLNSYINLYKALGGGWLSEEEMNNELNPQKK
jgi:outer membrane protein, multidrug efflux system